MTLRNGIAVVAGDGPLAEAIAARLAADGARVVRPRNGEPAEETIRRAASEGPLEILVTCYREAPAGSVEALSATDWARALDATVTATALACRAALGPMRQQGYGRIVAVADRQYLGAPGRAALGAATAGVVSLARTLALEAARDGVTVSCVVPGTIDLGQLDELPEEQRERLRKLQPGGRFGTPEDVASAVAFFAAEESGYITGQTLFVCGGTSLYSSLSV